jgi:hypothetical protein
VRSNAPAATPSEGGSIRVCFETTDDLGRAKGIAEAGITRLLEGMAEPR